jgi:3-dehydroquinate dehydratase/shikimate dehydrogenase
VHNAAFAAEKVNAVYLPMLVREDYTAFKAFMVEVLARPWLGIRGLSVTIPHKENALRFLRENGFEIDPLAARVGAVNTLKLDADGRVRGFSTDYGGALDAICRGMSCDAAALKGVDVCILGAGGVARAIVSALVDSGASVTVFNRTSPKAEALANELGCAWKPWEQRTEVKPRLIVNCTSVGMWPGADLSPLPVEALSSDSVVFDTIYNPPQTRLLREATARGCRIIEGMTMFAAQARQQFLIWNQRGPNAEFFENEARAVLNRPTL